MSKVNTTEMVYAVYNMEPTLIVDATTEWPAITDSLSPQELIKVSVVSVKN